MENIDARIEAEFVSSPPLPEFDVFDPERLDDCAGPLDKLGECDDEFVYACLFSVALRVLGFVAVEFWCEADEMALDDGTGDDICILGSGRLETASARLTKENLSLNSPSVLTDKS